MLSSRVKYDSARDFEPVGLTANAARRDRGTKGLPGRELE